jgi:hypothetical protein
MRSAPGGRARKKPGSPFGGKFSQPSLGTAVVDFRPTVPLERHEQPRPLILEVAHALAHRGYRRQRIEFLRAAANPLEDRAALLLAQLQSLGRGERALLGLGLDPIECLKLLDKKRSERREIH